MEAIDSLPPLVEKAFHQESPTLIEELIDDAKGADVWNKELNEIIFPLNEEGFDRRPTWMHADRER